MNLTELKEKPIQELVEMAEKIGVENVGRLRKQDIIFTILKDHSSNGEDISGGGVLEILQDGFGFLRNASSSYLAGPDDIYVSPSQIRRFGLQTGSHVAGQIRPPKINERYFALLRIEAINREDPNRQKRIVPFEELTPLHPDQRIMMERDHSELSTRVVDLLAPIGFGQRGLIVSPPRAGKTIILQNK